MWINHKSYYLKYRYIDFYFKDNDLYNTTIYNNLRHIRNTNFYKYWCFYEKKKYGNRNQVYFICG